MRTLSAERPTIKREVSWEVEEPPVSGADLVAFTRETVPHVVLPAEKILRLKVDARAGFVLSLVDGKTSVEALGDITNLDEGELVEVLHSLRALGAIARHPRKIT